MQNSLEEGQEFVGHVYGLGEEPTAGFLRLTGRGATLVLPRTGQLVELYELNNVAIPHSIYFINTDGMYALAGCRSQGTSFSSTGAGNTRILALRVIKIGAVQSDFSRLDGMITEIDGLPTWADHTAVTLSIESDPLAVNLRAAHPEPITLGGSPETTISSFWQHHPYPTGNTFEITDIAQLRTTTHGLEDWKQHETVHHMFQDLMCLVYGRPCLSRIDSVKREDEQENFEQDENCQIWREVYEPSFGRTGNNISPFLRGTSSPLFYLRDVDREKLSQWIDEWSLWSRPTWIAVSTMFQRGVTAENALIQIGVALESLGYALWQESSPSPKSRTPTYPNLLQQVIDSSKVSHPKIFGDLDAQAWATSFNTAFKGCKHADNPLPDGYSAHLFSTQGMNLIRAWLAIHLGVSEETLINGFDNERYR